MITENRFNLIDESWVPLADTGLVSLKQLFSDPPCRSLGGSPIEKIALNKLCLAIAQAATTPNDDDEWGRMRPEGLARECLSYLERWHDRFYLFGERPFLQIPAIRSAELKPYGTVSPEVSTGNSTVFFQSEIERDLTDSEKALLIVRLMGCALGGKQTDNSIILSLGYPGKTKQGGKENSGKEGPFIGARGYLHTFLQGNSFQETLWVNLFSRQRIQGLGAFPEGVGIPPWEEMPQGEDCPLARRLKSSFMGRLIPMSRFCLLEEKGLRYSEGIAYPGYKEGGRDPSVALDSSGKNPKVLWTDPEKRPWRSLTALLSLVYDANNKKFECYQIGLLGRVRDHLETVGIWSGGLCVRGTAGEQKVSGSCDYVESLVWIPCEEFGTLSYANLSREMESLDFLWKETRRSIVKFFTDQKMKDSALVRQAENLFWQLCEPRFQNLLDSCLSENSAKSVRPTYARIAEKVYDTYCPRETARQIDAWACNRPVFHRYFNR